MSEICDACNGTGIEEGREWDGYRCSECKGLGHIKDRPVCPGCGNEIDPDCCGCGDYKEGHDAMWLGHSFVPMGCDCMRDRSAPSASGEQP